MDEFIILDRDGVINVDLMTYVTKPEDFKPITGSLEAIALLNNNGYKIAIATNTSGITTIFSLYPISKIGAIVKLTIRTILNYIDAITTRL